MKIPIDQIYPMDILIKGHTTNLVANDDEVILLETKDFDEMNESGLYLPFVTTNRFDSVTLPKWKVVTIGENAEKRLAIKQGDTVVVQHMKGKFRTIYNLETRVVKWYHIMAKINYETKDWENIIKKSFKKG